MVATPPNFDPIARPYRWLEYLSFGRSLERARFHFLGEMRSCKRALVLGDGDGRFTAKLLDSNPEIHVNAIDSSAAMLRLLTARAARLGPSALNRLCTTKIDALEFIAKPQPQDESPYDLLATHFFLDCFTEDDVTTLVRGLAPRLTPNALWVVSEFAIPHHQPATLGSQIIVAGLYRAFRLITGLRTQTLPDYAKVFRESGLALLDSKEHLGGLLVSELWNHP